MGHIVGTQEFLAAHKDHKITVDIIESTQEHWQAEIYSDSSGSLRVGLTKRRDIEHLERSGAYVLCTECNIEEEVNTYEVDED